ncbi:hypothetical protein LNTAR_11986 [Lentisphaera araneosa HTCC2155]|uniref:Alpha/beta hydrolase fold-3 domain-containing protein n=1 Tax=Lentisphaera araneosa HTCC2155 TaxID=313628 RepID=A6DJJ8_9BACT|nr:hypothetical protein [Lentisphaera araneosa]EDM28072.1 hypothetical protein LNTAR_11986 [Lentisphaera araneosa HTCC2155]
MKRKSIHIITFLVVLSTLSLLAGDSKRKTGYNSLFMGHSFFWPAGNEVGKLISKTAIKDHQQYMIKGGDSAGGHISLLAALNTKGLNDPTDSKNIDTSIVAYIGYNPAFTERDHEDPQVDVLCHLNDKFPPSLILFGDQDPWLKGWNQAHKKLTQMGVKNVELKIAKNEGHAFWIYQPWSDILLIESDKFLAKLGLIEGEPTLKMPQPGEQMISATE